ncbi:MAG: DUF790 family protein [Caldilineaceae bacterium]
MRSAVAAIRRIARPRRPVLTGDLVRPRLYHRGGQLYVRTLNAADPYWQQTANALISLMQAHVNQPQGAWQQALETYEGERIDYTIVRGLAKVLSDGATFEPVQTLFTPLEVRERLFARGPAFAQPDLLHPQSRAEIVAETAAALGMGQSALESALYADRPTAYLLTDAGPAWTPTELIARYNLELSRAALYWSDQMQVHIYDGFKDFWKYVKLFKLMFWATPLADEIDGKRGYSVTLDGPISPFVKATTRYGRQLAAFLPALFLCQHWRMWASVRPPPHREPLTYHLNHTTPLTTHFKGSGEFDSRMEADFAAEFAEKFGDKRGQWLLTREDEVILVDDTVMIPDFAFTHKKDGRRALLEIVGFWHPEYLARKIKKVRAAKRNDLILLVYEGVNLAKEQLDHIPAEVLYFRNKPVLKEVMAAVEKKAS